MSYHINEGLFAAIAPTIDATVGTVLYVVFFIAACAVGYLLGSINSAILVSKALYGDDIRKHGSGNAGLTNMLRTYGGRAAVLTLLGDVLKAVLTVVFAGILLGFQYFGGICVNGDVYMAALFAVVGHIFPLYHGLRGGKGVLVTATVALVLSPIPFAVLFGCFALILYLTKYVSLSSVTVAILYPIALRAYFMIRFPNAGLPGYIALASIIIAILIVFCHRENLKRIGNRTERTFSFHKSKESSDDEKDGHA